MTRTTQPVRHVALVGNFPPRQCGIATFTADLHAAMRGTAPDLRISTVAMTDPGHNYAYPPEVGYEIAQSEPACYAAAAEHINALNPDIISIQHEFGIFGGAAGEHLLKLTEHVRAPIVTTLHTVLNKPTVAQHRVMQQLAADSARLIVMSEKGRMVCTEHWHIASDKIAVIPHGIPDLPFVDPASRKHHFGLTDCKVALTFGLLSPNKGIEMMIKALPALTKAHPDLIYVVLGATHPHRLETEGEAYRNSLAALAQQLGVTGHVRFVNNYVDQTTLQLWLAAADVYVTPYLHEAQITSGTLAYAVGLGKAVVSTPFWHACELLADDAGALVPFADPAALASVIGDLLHDDIRRNRIRSRAYRAGRRMIWPEVGRAYLEVFDTARANNRRAAKIRPLPTRKIAAPAVTLAAIDRLVDDCGMLQHSRYTVADRRHGYCLDDNARALMLAVDLQFEGLEAERATRIIATCAAFVDDAWDEEHAVFRNFMDYQRNWLEPCGSQDSHGRALWALGRVLAGTDDQELEMWAAHLAEQVIPATWRLQAPRARAFAILGLVSLLSAYPGHRPARALLADFATRLHEQLLHASHASWTWFEPILSYDNARLPEALLRAGQLLGQDDMVTDGIAALDWLARIQTTGDGVFRPIGTNSFGRVYNTPPMPFDQQPIEAWATIDACRTAFNMTGESKWQQRMEAAFDWYLGRNDLGLRIATANGGCFDGLEVDRVNRNQGAESILAFQFAGLALRQMQCSARVRDKHSKPARA